MSIRQPLIAAVGFLITLAATASGDTLEERILLRDSLRMLEEQGSLTMRAPAVLYFDNGCDNIGVHRVSRSLPEGLRSALEDNPEAIDEPASAQEPCNLCEPMIHPELIVKALQESIERLSAAGLKSEAAEAAQLLKKFEQNHQVRMLMERQDADLAKYRSELDRLQRRLEKFDNGKSKVSRDISVSQVHSTAVKKLDTLSYTMSPVWLERLAKENNRSVNDPRTRR